MDFNEIRKLVKLVESARISSLEIEEEGLAIRIEKSIGGAANAVVQMPQAEVPVVAAPLAAPAPIQAPVESAADNLTDLRSPMVGTFYASPSPEADAFVKVGDTVKKGQTLCILEAMKIMNEIESECDGRIVEVLVKNSDPVQFDQVLFRIEA